MLFGKPAVLSLLLIWVVRAQNDTNTRGGFIDNGVVETNGTESGETLAHQDELYLEKIKEEEKEMEGHGEEEGNMEELQTAYDQWMADCIADGAYPEITDQVREVLNVSGLSEDEMKAECDNPSGETSRKRRRVKRTLIRSDRNKWDKCIVPFVYNANLPEAWKNAVELAHDRYKQFTGFRFVPYTGDNTDYGLEHNYYLDYKDGGSCWSHFGNLKWNGGQPISPCADVTVAAHEMAHALGLAHEQQMPHAFDMLSIHYKFIKEASSYNYKKLEYLQVYDAENEEYDISSFMSYPDYFFRKNYGRTMSTNDPEFRNVLGSENDYYTFRDLMEFYNCFDQFPDTCTTIPTCENDGYPSVLDGKCGCRCPPNLDPATNCATKLVFGSNNDPWPAGTFSIPMVKDAGCPAGLSFGSMTRWNTASARDYGNMFSQGWKDGIERTHDVCTQTSSSGTGTWPAGRYCLLQRGTCPDGFAEGVISAYGQAPKREDYTTGALPDGEKGQFFEYKFCCRQDGDFNTKISLPNTVPFILYAPSYQECQQVAGMQGIQQYYQTRSDQQITRSGQVPDFYYFSAGQADTSYCYYTPEQAGGCGELKTFTTETSYEFTTPNYPNKYPTLTECFWFYKSPEGTTMKIEFPDFEVSTASDTQCSSYVELRTVSPATNGFKFCGHGYFKWHQTVKNYLTLKFASASSEPWKGFKARITILKETDKCYKGDGKDRSYAGTLDYTKRFKQCLQWKDVDCPFNQFAPVVQDVDLSHNYCRNVGTGRMPWCYTNAELCVRDNCDACMIGTCYNTRTDCQTLIANDAQFCAKNENGLAKSCMLACGFCASHTPKTAAGSVTCPTPGQVDGISPEPASGTFNAGDVVTYKCATSNTIKTRTCTSEGTWTHIGYVCSGCPTGWTVVLGRCYKWLGWNVQQTYKDAKASCAALNSNLAILDSQEAIDIVNTLTDYGKDEVRVIWLGINVDSNRVFKWDDGTDVSEENWKTGQPNNWGNNENCVIGSEKGTWDDISCDSSTRKHQIVCTYTPTATFVCKDDRPNCAQIMAGTPDMCQNKAGYAWANCRKACAISSCVSSVTCSVTAPSDATRNVGSDSLTQGKYVEYKCNTGFLKSGGDEQRVCLPSGQLSGDDLVCTAITSTTNYEMFSDVELWRREYKGDTMKRVAIAIQDPSNSKLAIKYAGKITAWTYYSNFKGEIAFQIWRPNTDATKEHTYVFIGQNTVTASAENRISTVKITDSAAQISAQPGDVIGVYMKNEVLTFTRCESARMPERSVWYKTTSAFQSSTEFTANSEHEFEISKEDCRLYSLRVTMNLSG